MTFWLGPHQEGSQVFSVMNPLLILLISFCFLSCEDRYLEPVYKSTTVIYDTDGTWYGTTLEGRNVVIDMVISYAGNSYNDNKLGFQARMYEFTINVEGQESYKRYSYRWQEDDSYLYALIDPLTEKVIGRWWWDYGRIASFDINVGDIITEFRETRQNYNQNELVFHSEESLKAYYLSKTIHSLPSWDKGRDYYWNNTDW